MSALIWCPFADEESAAAIARQLLEERLVACANILPPMRSIFMWQGEIGESAETGVLFKTDASLLDRATARLTEIHPYEVPAVLGWRTDAAGAPAADWLRSLVQDASGQQRHNAK